MNRSKFAIIFSTLYLFMFLVMIHTGYTTVIWSMFLFSPIIVISTVYTVIRYGTYSGTELKEDEEWGYEDVDKEKLGTF